MHNSDPHLRETLSAAFVILLLLPLPLFVAVAVALLVSNKHSCKFVSLKPFSACTQLIYFSLLSQNGFIVWNFNAFFLFQPTDSLSNSVTKIAICSFNLFKNSKKKLPFDNFAFTFNVHSIHCYLAICFRLQRKKNGQQQFTERNNIVNLKMSAQLIELHVLQSIPVIDLHLHVSECVFVLWIYTRSRLQAHSLYCVRGWFLFLLKLWREIMIIMAQAMWYKCDKLSLFHVVCIFPLIWTQNINNPKIVCLDKEKIFTFLMKNSLLRARISTNINSKIFK